jgi:hypothetical protein
MRTLVHIHLHHSYLYYDKTILLGGLQRFSRLSNTKRSEFRHVVCASIYIDRDFTSTLYRTMLQTEHAKSDSVIPINDTDKHVPKFRSFCITQS